MPLPCDPNRVVPIFLAGDAAKDEANRPTFIARFLASTNYLALTDLVRQAASYESTPDGDAKSHALLCRALAIALVDWRNVFDQDGQPVPFAMDKDASGKPAITALSTALTPSEMWELAAGINSKLDTAERLIREMSRAKNEASAAA